MAREQFSNTQFINHQIRDGAFIESIKEERPGYVKHVSTKTGKVSYIASFNSLSGIPYRLKIREVKMNDSTIELLEFQLKDPSDGVMYSVSFNYNNSNGLSGYARSLAKYLPNIDINKIVNISADNKKNAKGFTIQSFFIKQDGINIKTYYNKSNLPECKITENFKKEKKYDFTDIDKILNDAIEEFSNKLEDRLKSETISYSQTNNNYNSSPSSQYSKNNEDHVSNQDQPSFEEDDLPF